MRILNHAPSIFDTRIDTKKIFVPMKHKFHPHNHIGKDGKSLLYLHVWTEHPAKKIDTEIRVDRKFWDFKTKRQSKHCPNGEDINLMIDQTESRITDIKIRYRLGEKVLTVEKFIEEFKHGSSKYDFIEYFYLNKELELSTKKIKFNTWKKENSVWKKLKEYKSSIPFSSLTIKDIHKFVAYRKSNNMKMTTINSNLGIIKKYVTMAFDDGIKMGITPKQIVVGSTDGNREALSFEELRKYMSYYESEFLRDNHKVPLCRFLFSCFTGLRIGDNQDLSFSNFYEGKISFEAEKTEKKNKIMLNKTSMRILKRCPEVFTTTFSDKHINEKLQEAADFLGIRTHVTFHISRHTFATNFLNMGGKLEVLQKLLDHQSIETTMIYVHINKEQQNKEIMLLDNMFTKDSQTLQ